MSPLIPVTILLFGIASVSTAVGLAVRDAMVTRADNQARTDLLRRQDALIAQQVLMLEGRDKDLQRREAEVTLMAKFTKILVAKLQERPGGVLDDDGQGKIAAEVLSPPTVPPSPVAEVPRLAAPMEDMVRDVMPSLAGGVAQ